MVCCTPRRSSPQCVAHCWDHLPHVVCCISLVWCTRQRFFWNLEPWTPRYFARLLLQCVAHRWDRLCSVHGDSLRGMLHTVEFFFLNLIPLTPPCVAHRVDCLCEIKTKFENTLARLSGAQMDWNQEKMEVENLVTHSHSHAHTNFAQKCRKESEKNVQVLLVILGAVWDLATVKTLTGNPVCIIFETHEKDQQKTTWVALISIYLFTLWVWPTAKYSNGKLVLYRTLYSKFNLKNDLGKLGVLFKTFLMMMKKAAGSVDMTVHCTGL